MAITQDSKTWSTVYCGIAVLCVGHGDFCGRCADVAITVSYFQRDDVNAGAGHHSFTDQEERSGWRLRSTSNVV